MQAPSCFATGNKNLTFDTKTYVMELIQHLYPLEE